MSKSCPDFDLLRSLSRSLLPLGLLAAIPTVHNFSSAHLVWSYRSSTANQTTRSSFQYARSNMNDTDDAILDYRMYIHHLTRVRVSEPGPWITTFGKHYWNTWNTRGVVSTVVKRGFHSTQLGYVIQQRRPIKDIYFRTIPWSRPYWNTTSSTSGF